MFILFIYLASLLSITFTIYYYKRQIESRYLDDSKNYTIDNITVNREDILYNTVKNYCDTNVLTAECESWDVFDNKVLIGYNGDNQSHALLTIVANLFSPSNIHVVNYNPHDLDDLKNMFDNMIDGSLITYYQYNKSIDINREVKDWNEYQRLSLLTCYKDICTKHSINIILEASTQEDIHCNLINRIRNSRLYEYTEGLNIYRPFQDTSIEQVSRFMERYYNNYYDTINYERKSVHSNFIPYGSNKQPYSPQCTDLSYRDLSDNIMPFYNEYNYMLNTVADNINIKDILIKLRFGLVFRYTDSYPEKIINNILDIIIQEYTLPKLDATIRHGIYLKQGEIYVNNEWSICCTDDNVFFYRKDELAIKLNESYNYMNTMINIDKFNMNDYVRVNICEPTYLKQCKSIPLNLYDNTVLFLDGVIIYSIMNSKFSNSKFLDTTFIQLE